MHTPFASYFPRSLHLLSLSAAVAFIGLPACSTVRTVSTPVNAPGPGYARAGLHYFLPRGILAITGTQTNQSEYVITITRHNEPDQTDRYWLTQTTSLIHDDETHFKVTDQGLLTETVNSTGTPKIDGILDNLLSTAINVGKILIKLDDNVVKTAAAGDKASAAKLPKPFRVTFDPLDPGDVAAANRSLRAANIKVDITTTKYDKRLAWGNNQPHWDPRVITPQSHEGIFYRPLTTVKLRMEYTDQLNNNPYVISQYVAIPDPDSIATYRMSRGLFSKRTQNAVFTNGEPRQLDFNYPSELYAATTIPVTLTSKVLSSTDVLPALTRLFYKPKADPNATTKAETEAIKAASANAQAKEEYLVQAQKTAAVSESLRNGELIEASTSVQINQGPSVPARQETPAEKLERENREAIERNRDQSGTTPDSNENLLLPLPSNEPNHPSRAPGTDTPSKPKPVSKLLRNLFNKENQAATKASRSTSDS